MLEERTVFLIPAFDMGFSHRVRTFRHIFTRFTFLICQSTFFLKKIQALYLKKLYFQVTKLDSVDVAFPTGANNSASPDCPIVVIVELALSGIRPNQLFPAGLVTETTSSC